MQRRRVAVEGGCGVNATAPPLVQTSGAGSVQPNTNTSANTEFNVLHIASSFTYDDFKVVNSPSSPLLGSNGINTSAHARNHSCSQARENDACIACMVTSVGHVHPLR